LGTSPIYAGWLLCGSMAGEAVQQLVAAWIQNAPLVALASAGMMARVKGKDEITRADVCQNFHAIQPVVRYLGEWAALIQLAHMHVF